ncbi:radical SAM protein [Erysipelothrix sp. D19-032]
MNIRLSSFISDSIVDGEGIRSVIFTQGCPHNCPGCHNQKSIPYDGGELIAVDDVITQVLDANLGKVTFSGGEPFIQAEALYLIAKRLKEEGYNLWSYTGFKYEALMRHQDPYVQKFLGCLDILIDGRFMIRKKSMAKHSFGARQINELLMSHNLFFLEKLLSLLSLLIPLRMNQTETMISLFNTPSGVFLYKKRHPKMSFNVFL